MPGTVTKLSSICHLPKKSINRILQWEFPVLTGYLTLVFAMGCSLFTERLMCHVCIVNVIALCVCVCLKSILRTTIM